MNNKGFTLIEILIATVILIICTSGVVSANAVAQRYARANRQYIVGHNLLNDQYERTLSKVNSERLVGTNCADSYFGTEFDERQVVDDGITYTLWSVYMPILYEGMNVVFACNETEPEAFYLRNYVQFETIRGPRQLWRKTSSSSMYTPRIKLWGLEGRRRVPRNSNVELQIIFDTWTEDTRCRVNNGIGNIQLDRIRFRATQDRNYELSCSNSENTETISFDIDVF